MTSTPEKQEPLPLEKLFLDIAFSSLAMDVFADTLASPISKFSNFSLQHVDPEISLSNSENDIVKATGAQISLAATTPKMLSSSFREKS